MASFHFVGNEACHGFFVRRDLLLEGSCPRQGKKVDDVNDMVKNNDHNGKRMAVEGSFLRHEPRSVKDILCEKRLPFAPDNLFEDPEFFCFPEITDGFDINSATRYFLARRLARAQGEQKNIGLILDHGEKSTSTSSVPKRTKDSHATRISAKESGICKSLDDEKRYSGIQLLMRFLWRVSTTKTKLYGVEGRTVEEVFDETQMSKLNPDLVEKYAEDFGRDYVFFTLNWFSMSELQRMIAQSFLVSASCIEIVTQESIIFAPKKEDARKLNSLA